MSIAGEAERLVAEDRCPLIGIVLCCHGSMGDGCREAAEMIVGEARGLAVVGVFPGDGLEKVVASIRRGVEEVDEGDGVIVMADMPGGTPYNLLAAELARPDLELLAGFNLPALLKVLSGRRREKDVRLLARTAAECGRGHMVLGLDSPDPGCDLSGARR